MRHRTTGTPAARARHMVRLAFLVAVLAGCAHGVTEPNSPGPPTPQGNAPYAGRIVLRTSALRDEVDQFANAWTRRLSILGVTAKITYDDDRGVVDVYGIVDLAFVSRVLAEPGGYFIDQMLVDGDVSQWFAPDITCGCSGRVWLALAPSQMCHLANGIHMVARNGMLAEVTTKRFWAVVDSSRYYDTPPDPGGCSKENAYWIHHLLVGLPPTATKEQNLEIVLALGGGILPAVPTIEKVQRGVP
jgi:hypothetical protein